MSVEPPLMRDVLNGVLNSRVDSSGLYSSFPATQMSATELAAQLAATTALNPINFNFSYAAKPYDLRRAGLVANTPSAATSNTNALKNLIDPVIAGPPGRYILPNIGGNDKYWFNDLMQMRSKIRFDLDDSEMMLQKSYAVADDFMGLFTFIQDVTIENGSLTMDYPGTGGNNPGPIFRVGSRTGYKYGSYAAGIFDQDDLVGLGLAPMGMITLRNLRLKSNNPAAMMILMLGGLRNVVIDNIEFDGQGAPTYCIYYEFGFASTNAAPGTPALWSSSHMTNAAIRNIRARNMGAGAGYAVSMIGAYSVYHENIRSEGNYGTCEYRPGEALFYRPWVANDTAGAKRGMIYRNIVGQDTTTNCMSLVGAEAPLGYLAGAGLTVYQQLDLMSFDVDGFSCKQAGGNGISASGPITIRNGRTTGCFNGIVLANECIQFSIDMVDVFDSTNVGIRMDGTSPILTRYKIGSIRNSYVAGSTGAGVALDYIETATVEANRFGYNVAYSPTAETTQTFGVSVGNQGFGVVVRNNYVGAATGGIAYNKTGGPQNCIMQNPVGVSTTQGNWLHVGQLESILTFGGTITPDCSQGNEFVINATTAGAFTIAVPTNPKYQQRVTFSIRNASGGALGAVTWNAIFKLSAWVSPANGFNRSIDYKFDGTNWIEVSRTPADVPN